MKSNVVFFDYGINEGRYADWSVFYYLDEQNVPHAITYKTIPLKNLEGVCAGDGWLTARVTNETKSYCLYCYGEMIPEMAFVKQFKLTDRRLVAMQTQLAELYRRSTAYEEFARRLSLRMFDRIYDYIHSQYNAAELETYVMQEIQVVHSELCGYKDIFTFDDDNKYYHPAYDIDVPALKPSVTSSIDDEGNVTIHLNKDAETIMKLIRFDINNVIGKYK